MTWLRRRLSDEEGSALVEFVFIALVVFGASHQLVTGLVNRQAQHVLDSVGNKTYTATGARERRGQPSV